MDTITVSLPDDRLRALQKLSSQLNVSPEELIRLSIEELLTRPREASSRLQTTFSKRIVNFITVWLDNAIIWREISYFRNAGSPRTLNV